MSVNVKKEELRWKIWKLMEERNLAVFPRPVYHRIPNFVGSEKAAERLRKTDEWKRARVVVSNPDYAQRKVREFALKDGKTLLMASPKLKCGYLLINPKDVKGIEDVASTIKGAFKFGSKLKGLIKPDLIVTGSVAVDMYGNRLGKGLGLGDREISYFKRRFGKIIVVTTVHDVQVVERVPSEEHDERVDIIATPSKLIRCKSANINPLS